VWLHPKGVHPLSKEGIEVIILGSRNVETKQVVQNVGIDDIVDISPWIALDVAYH